MKKKTVAPILGQVLRKIAPRVGATVVIEPEWGIVGQVRFKSGRKRYFKGSIIDLNHVGASDIAKDKDFANFFMKRMGYPTVPGSRTFFSNEWAETIGSHRRKIDDAYRYARRLGFPVIVKPNSGSQGAAISLVHNRQEFYRAVRVIFRRDRVALVQHPVVGKDYRLVVLDKRVISAYERIPLNVTGDGKSTIRTLLKAKQKQFVASGRDTQIKLDDPRTVEKLRRRGFTMKSVPIKGDRVYLLDNANLSTGGDSIDVTSTVHSAFRKIVVNLTLDMGLRLSGVDLIVYGDISKKPDKYWILEVNAAPGLDHYAKTGKEQEKIVEDLYLRVLKSMER